MLAETGSSAALGSLADERLRAVAATMAGREPLPQMAEAAAYARRFAERPLRVA